MRELAFERMIERGLEDSRKGRVISNEDMGRRIRSASRIDVLGVFHGALEIDKYLP
ncbi:MAG: hypothetical protein KAU31_09980 [Spirochaetaceae bacterium]|nr:hypothetical protein [Spirochaetaceae bacterium]